MKKNKKLISILRKILGIFVKSFKEFTSNNNNGNNLRKILGIFVKSFKEFTSNNNNGNNLFK